MKRTILQVTLHFPLFEVFRGEDPEGFFEFQQDDPLLCFIKPDSFGVAIAPDDVFLYGISFVLRKGPAAIVTVRNALCIRFSFRPFIYTTSAGVYEYKRRFAADPESSRVFPVHNTRTREDCTQFIRIDRIAQFGPVDEVCTDSVPPCLVVFGSGATERTVLIKEMVLSVVVHQSVCIIDPAAFGSKMELRTEFLLIQFFLARKSVGLKDRIETLGIIRIQLINLKGCFFAPEVIYL